MSDNDRLAALLAELADEGWLLAGGGEVGDLASVMVAAGVTLAATPAPLDVVGAARAVDGCIAIVQQSLDSIRAEDDGESRSMKASIAAREHVIWLLSGYRDEIVATSHRVALAATPAPLDGHQTPGEFHDYRVACVKCGEPGFLHVSWRPEKYEDPS